MKIVKVALFAVLGTLVAIGLSTTAYSFHSGGVAECEGCHSMHSPKADQNKLLKGSDGSSTCLSCHEHLGDTGPSSYHISTALGDVGDGIAPKQLTPGGDFGWLRKSYTASYTNTSTGDVTTHDEPGAMHGHNVVAADSGYDVDTRFTTAPGGTFLSSKLSCQACHDPHSSVRRNATGEYVRGGVASTTAVGPIVGSGSTGTIPTGTDTVGAYRLLRGLGDTYEGATFAGVAEAVSPSSYNRTEAVTQTRVAYGATGTNTWGNWCASCHPDMHSSGNYVHPVDEGLGATIAGLYTAYIKSGDMTGGATTAYSSLVPFAEFNASIATLKSHAKTDDTLMNGPGTDDQVMCLSCHRAHASGMVNALRFDQGYEFMTVGSNFLGKDNPLMTAGRGPLQHRGRTMAEWQKAYYDRPVTKFASYQRVLCNKCHAKD